MKGHRISLASRARAAGLPYSLVTSRVHRLGWPIERALSTPEPDYTATEKRNAKARARTIQAMAEREATAAECEVERRNARAAAAAAHTRSVEVSQRDLDLYSPRHVTTREAVALPPRHQAPVEAMLADGLISQFADALAVAEAETYDAVFDPDFYLTNPVCEFWRGLKRDRATP
jgi:hypothetical protein